MALSVFSSVDFSHSFNKGDINGMSQQNYLKFQNLIIFYTCFNKRVNRNNHVNNQNIDLSNTFTHEQSLHIEQVEKIHIFSFCTNPI